MICSKNLGSSKNLICHSREASPDTKEKLMMLMRSKFKVTDTDFEKIWIHFHNRRVTNYKVHFVFGILTCCLQWLCMLQLMVWIPFYQKGNCSKIFFSITVFKEPYFKSGRSHEIKFFPSKLHLCMVANHTGHYFAPDSWQTTVAISQVRTTAFSREASNSVISTEVKHPKHR